MQKASCTQKPSAPLLQKESARVISKGGIATGIHIYIYLFTDPGMLEMFVDFMQKNMPSPHTRLLLGGYSDLARIRIQGEICPI